MKKVYDIDKISTKLGDGGKSSDWSGDYYSKDDILFETLGNIDELTCWLGKIAPWNHPVITTIQKVLQDGASLVATNPRFNVRGEPTNTRYIPLRKLDTKDVEFLESWESWYLNKGIEIAEKFILPGEHDEDSVDVDIARAVCRRTERSVVRFMNDRNGERYDLKYVSMYLNRLSDLLFILARSIEQGKEERF